jgi:large subunit ribosomal protein L5e
MTFLRVVKSKAYFKRFQVKYKRRREGKTDYYARKRLVAQDKTKYNSPKYRLVVRFSNKDVIAQIIYATLHSDVVLSSAYAHELPRFGLKVKNCKDYAAAYATGLLLARRALTKLGLATQYVGQEKPDGAHFIVEESGERRPLLVLLDVGLHCTSTGARVFGAMKGAADGGLEVPHNTRRFPGFNADNKKFDPAVLRKYIFGGHVADYQKKLQESDAEKYKTQFSQYIKAGVKPDGIEAMWTAVHKEIRKDPSFIPTKKNNSTKPAGHLMKKKNNKQRKNRVKHILASAEKAAAK